MIEFFSWVGANGQAVAAAFVALHGAALAIVNLTPTPADDAFLGKVYKVVEFFAGLVTSKAKQ